MQQQQRQESTSSSVEFGDEKLPLELIKSEAIPPCPTRSESCIDWLPDFSGYSWLAYASSSLLVISHLPIDGPAPAPAPIFRQVFELGGGVVSAVCWSPLPLPLAYLLLPWILLFAFSNLPVLFLGGRLHHLFNLLRSRPLSGLLQVMASFLLESKSYCGEETTTLLPGKLPGCLHPTCLRI